MSSAYPYYDLILEVSEFNFTELLCSTLLLPVSPHCNFIEKSQLVREVRISKKQFF